MQLSKYTCFFLRLPLALSMLGHGLVRISKLGTFSNWMAGFMSKSILPQALVTGFGYMVPFWELIVGVLLLAGWYTKQALYLGLLLMALFVFGNTTIENWEPITSELVHAGYMAGLLCLFSYHQAVDASAVKN